MTYYIDSSSSVQGNGSSPDSPLLSHESVALRPGDTMLFKRGTCYRGGVFPPDGTAEAPITIGAYGEGPAPRFYGSVDASRPEFWREETPGVWRFQGILESEVCNIVFDGGESFGILAWTPEAMDAPGKWRFSAPFCAAKAPPNASLLLCSDSNPAECHRSIEICIFGARCMITAQRHVRFEDLHLLCSGVHGFAAAGAEDIVVRRCEFSFIGGCPWRLEDHIRFGNGVEFWDGARDCLVEGCVFREIYDSCATTQGPGEKCRPFERIRFERNRCVNYGMAAFELRDRIGEDVVFNDNDCEGAGAGFSMQDETPPRASEIHPEPMGHHVFAWRIDHAWTNGRMEILRNAFRGSPTGAVFYDRISAEAMAQIATDVPAGDIMRPAVVTPR